MKEKFLIPVFSLLSFIAFSQSNDVNLAAIAWEKGHFENAWENANTALQSSQNLDKALMYRAYCIRGKAGTRISYNALTSDQEQETEKYATMALRAYQDFKEVLATKDSAMVKDVTAEFYKLGHALLLSGTDYDALNADKEKPDSSLIDKSIECYTATIELWELAGKEKYKPFYYRGDALLAKKKYDQAIADFERAMAMFIAATRKTPDLGIGDLGYRLAYTQAGVYNNKNAALKTIEKTRGLLDAEMRLADSKKEKLTEMYEDIKTEYGYLIGELDNLKKSVTK